MGDDDVEDRLALAGMEVERARLDRVLAEPPAQQFRRHRGDQFEDVGDAVFQADTELFGALGQGCGQGQRIGGITHGSGPHACKA